MLTVSVITVALNARLALRATIRSVLSQTYPHIEFIVVDGGSTDGSVDVLQEFSNRIDHWTSEPDAGIYAAMNKAVGRSTGDWVIFMNAGDQFASPDVIERVFTSPMDDNASFIFGNCVVDYGGYTVDRPAGSTTFLWKGSQFSHQAVFVRGDFQRAHLYNTRNRISADFEMFYAAHMSGLHFRQVEFPVARISPGGLSDRARLENIRSFYSVVRVHNPTIRTHAFFLCYLGLQALKLSLKALVPERLVHAYRRRFRPLT